MFSTACTCCSDGKSGQLLQQLLTEGRAAIHPGRGVSDISLASNLSDLDSRAIELLLGDHVDPDQAKVCFNNFVKKTLALITQPHSHQTKSKIWDGKKMF